MKRLPFFLNIFLALPLHAQVVSIQNNGTTKALVSPIQMTRIAVEEDRILNVFGNTKHFTLEKDEVLGQVFLLPLGKVTDFKISLITEKGLSQDLLLEVSERADAAVVLRPKNIKKQSLEAIHPSFSSDPYPQKVLALIKSMALGAEGFEGGEVLANRDRTYEGFVTIAQRTCESGRLEGTVYTLKNKGGRGPQNLAEADFIRPGDRAVALGTRVLQPQETTTLYIVGSTS